MDTLGARLGHTIGLANLEYQEVDVLCRFKSLGHTGQIVRGALVDPRGSTVVRLALTLGTSAEYLVAGKGAAPTAEMVLAAVRRAKRRGGGGHAAKITARNGPSKMNARTGLSRDRSNRTAGASR